MRVGRPYAKCVVAGSVGCAFAGDVGRASAGGVGRAIASSADFVCAGGVIAVGAIAGCAVAERATTPNRPTNRASAKPYARPRTVASGE